MRTTHRLLTAAATVALTAGVLTTTATAEAATGHRTAAHAPAHRATAYDVTIKPSTTELVSGKKITFKGQVSPKAAGQTVVLQQKIGDQGWKPTGTATLNKKGRYEVSDKPSTLLPRKYRVVKAASGAHKKGVSKKVAVTIYQWHKVYDLASRDSRNVVHASSLTIDMVAFPKSIVGGYYSADDPTGFIDYNFQRRCITLKATYGMSDDADTDSSAKIDVIGDGSELYTGTFALLESQKKTIDVHGVFRLAFQYTALGTAKAVPAFGSPEVLCSF